MGAEIMVAGEFPLHGLQQGLTPALGGRYGNRPTTSQVYNSANYGANPGQFTQLPHGISISQYAATHPYANCSTRPTKPLESSGIRVGEILGWRIWGLKGEYLTSYSAGRIWAPEEKMTGEPSDYGNDGIWSFKEKSRAIEKMLENSASHVLGSIKMWGKVIEYELGYRAECAKIMSIDDMNIFMDEDKISILKNLRKKYQIEEKP